MSIPTMFEKTYSINATIGEVWNHLTTPEKTRLFMYDCVPVTDWKIGSTLIWKGASDGVDYVKGRIVEFDPCKTLAFSVFDPNGPYPDVPENYLISRYELSETENGTMIHISQGDYSIVADGVKRYSEAQGGWDYAMDALNKLFDE